jgi:hypothetical protein
MSQGPAGERTPQPGTRAGAPSSNVKRHFSVIAAEPANDEQQKMLGHLLAVAKAGLKRANPRGTQHPRLILRDLAVRMADEVGFVKPKTLRAIAAATKLDLPLREAQSYCKAAQEGAGIRKWVDCVSG